jgi:hypothetical protein
MLMRCGEKGRVTEEQDGTGVKLYCRQKVCLHIIKSIDRRNRNCDGKKSSKGKERSCLARQSRGQGNQM